MAMRRALPGAPTVPILLALLAAAPASAAAELTLGGEAEARFFYTNNVTDAHTRGAGCLSAEGDPCDDQESFFDQRLRLRLAAAAGIARAVVMADFLSAPGLSASTLDGSLSQATGRQRFGREAFGAADDAPLVREAFLQINFPAAKLLAGRHLIRLGHGLLLDDHADGLSVVFPMGPTSLSVSGFKLIEADATALASSDGLDSDLLAVNFAGAPPGGWTIQAFALYLRDRRPSLFLIPARHDGGCGGCPLASYGDGAASVAAGGLAFDMKTERWRHALELNYLFGRIHASDPTALNPAGEHVELGGWNAMLSSARSVGKMELGAAALAASGQDAQDDPAAGGERLNLNAISPNYVFGLILVNNETTSDRAGGNIGNLIAARGALAWVPNPQLRGEFAFIWARLTEPIVKDGPTRLGYELDTTVVYHFDSQLSWSTGLGVLLTGDAWPTVFGEPGAVDNMIKIASKLAFAF